MRYLILMVGIPGSGKTTLRDKIKDAVVICPDEHIGYTKEKPWTFGAVKAAWKIADSLLKTAISESEEVIIFDATMVAPKRRRKYINIAEENGLTPIAIYCRVSLKVALERNGQREEFRKVPEFQIVKMHKSLTPPTIEEGFKKVLTFDSVDNKLDQVAPEFLKLGGV
jgi:predicted kinase